MKLNFYRDGTGFFPEYLKKRYEKELSSYQILKFEMGMQQSESYKFSHFVVGFSLRHKDSGRLACLLFNPMDMSCKIQQTAFPCKTFGNDEELTASGKFVFGSLQFYGDRCSLFVNWPCYFYCENMAELKELIELYALLSEDKNLIEAVATNEMPRPVIFDSFPAYAYYLSDENALVISRGEFSSGKSFTFDLESRNPETCFFIVNKRQLIFPEKKLYQQRDGKYFYFDGECFCPRRGKYVTEKEAQSMKERLLKEYPEASFWKRPLPCTLGWMLGVVQYPNNPVFLGVDLYSGNVELWENDDVLFPAKPDDKRFIFDA